MRILHLSDLHIGKRLLERSLLEDQKYILSQILQIIDQNSIETVLLAGDIYDKAVPSAEAVECFDQFLNALAKRRLNTIVISGNHDSSERIAFGHALMKAANVYMSPVYHGKIESINLEDSFGKIHFYSLPFVKPVHVRAYTDEEINNYTDALRYMVSLCNIIPNERNIALSHQFVLGATKGGSEELSVGGLEEVDASVFENFDYVALGHIHKAQNVNDHVRYSGTPLKYSFSEINDTKTVTILDVREKGNIAIETIELKPLRDMVELRGSFSELISNLNTTEDYYHIVLTDEEDIVNGATRLRSVYPNLLKLDYDNSRTRSENELTAITDLEEKTPLELFDQFYQLQNGNPLSEEQKTVVTNILNRLKGDNA